MIDRDTGEHWSDAMCEAGCAQAISGTNLEET